MKKDILLTFLTLTNTNLFRVELLHLILDNITNIVIIILTLAKVQGTGTVVTKKQQLSVE